MAKKLISIVLSVLLVFSTFAIGTFAADVITDEDRALYPEEELAISDPKERIDRCLLTGRTEAGANIQPVAGSKEVIEDNLYFWADEIIDEYHALEAKGDAATDAEWGALYRKMKTPHDNDFDEWGDFWYEYRDLSKGLVQGRFVPSKTEVKPGEEFTVELRLTTDFYFSHMYATVFYDNNLVDVKGCSEYYRGEDEDKHPEDKNVHELGAELSQYEYSEIKHYGDYDLAVYGDMRDVEWPDSLKAEEGCYDKYEGYNIIIEPNVSDYSNIPVIKADDTVIITYKFFVKPDAKVGETATLFAPGDSMYTTSKILDVYENPDNEMVAPCWALTHNDVGSYAGDMHFSDYLYLYDKTLDITPATIKIVGDEPQPSGADYTALDTAINGFNSSLSGLYTKDSWNAYASAVTAGTNVSRDLTADEQSTVDAATAAINEAKDALVLNKLISANTIGTPTIGSYANVEITATGSPKSIRLVKEGVTLTFNREDASIVANGDNEVWTIKVPVTAEQDGYNAFADYGAGYAETGVAVEINASTGLDLSIHSIVIPDMYPTGAYMDGKIYQGVHDIIIRTSKDVFKVQFVDPAGNTRTYDQVKYTPVEDGDELVWTIPFNFSALGNIRSDLRTRAVNTTFAQTGDYMTARVVY